MSGYRDVSCLCVVVTQILQRRFMSLGGSHTHNDYGMSKKNSPDEILKLSEIYYFLSKGKMGSCKDLLPTVFGKICFQLSILFTKTIK